MHIIVFGGFRQRAPDGTIGSKECQSDLRVQQNGSKIILRRLKNSEKKTIPECDVVFLQLINIKDCATRANNPNKGPNRPRGCDSNSKGGVCVWVCDGYYLGEPGRA